MSSWAYPVVALSVQWIVGILFPGRVNKGRIFTRPLYRFVPPPWTRFAQIFVILGVFEACWFGHFLLPHKQLAAVYWTVFIVLYLDDYITGDDDKWNKFKDAVKNKIKWLMDLPKEPVPEIAD